MDFRLGSNIIIDRCYSIIVNVEFLCKKNGNNLNSISHVVLLITIFNNFQKYNE